MLQNIQSISHAQKVIESSSSISDCVFSYETEFTKKWYLNFIIIASWFLVRFARDCKANC